MSRTPLEWALQYAEQLGPVLPLHTARNGVCDCSKRADCDKPGKHPRIEDWPNKVSRDENQIRRWWTMWPHANIGLALWPTSLVDVAPDCEQRLASFKRQGLPRTLTWQSGSGAGHVHYLYRKPDDWPTYRACHPGDYDILSDGYAVMPPSTNGAGPYVWLNDQTADLPVAPLWVKDYLPSKPTPRGNLPPGGDDEPPVRMTGRALARWQGDTSAFKAADRSGRLFAIANDLARANASLRTIAEALADRDTALGFLKFSGRDDASERYAEIALRALANAEAEATEGQLAPRADDDEGPPPKFCADTCAAQEMLEVIRGILANDNHSRSSAKVAVIGLILRHGWAFKRAPDVERPVNLTVLSKDVGLTNSTISAGIRLYDGKPGSPLQWRQGEAEDGNFARPTFVTLRAPSLVAFGAKAREFDPDIRKWGADRSPPAAPPCDEGDPAVAEVTERQTRTHLVCDQGHEYRHSRWQPGKTSVRSVLFDDTYAPAFEHAPQDGTTLERQLGPPPAESPNGHYCARCSSSDARLIRSDVLGAIALCERCWPGAAAVAS